MNPNWFYCCLNAAIAAFFGVVGNLCGAWYVMLPNATLAISFAVMAILKGER